MILRRYLPAMRAHLLARHIDADRVDDVLQGFVADNVIEYNLLGYADRARGKFRTFLLTALERFAANRLCGDTTAKRRPDGARVPSLALGGPADGPDGPDPIDPPDPRRGDGIDAFDVARAREVLAEAQRRMRRDCLDGGRGDLWELFAARVLAPALGDAEPPAYREVVARLGYRTPRPPPTPWSRPSGGSSRPCGRTSSSMWRTRRNWRRSWPGWATSSPPPPTPGTRRRGLKNLRAAALAAQTRQGVRVPGRRRIPRPEDLPTHHHTPDPSPEPTIVPRDISALAALSRAGPERLSRIWPGRRPDARPAGVGEAAGDAP